MFEIITRVRYHDLYERMRKSASSLAGGPVVFSSERDTDGLPRIAATYNRLGGDSTADYLIFAHDDIVFLEKEWDKKLIDEFNLTGADILGVAGRDNFGLPPDERQHCFGKYAGGDDDEVDSIKVLSGKCYRKRVDVVDGMFMAVRGDFFKDNRFDEAFDELWFYADDLCLRAKTYISNILIAHHKPAKYYGDYPAAMKPVSAYLDAFKAKWGRSVVPEMSLNGRCAAGPLDSYMELGQDVVYGWLTDRYQDYVKS